MGSLRDDREKGLRPRIESRVIDDEMVDGREKVEYLRTGITMFASSIPPVCGTTDHMEKRATIGTSQPLKTRWLTVQGMKRWEERGEPYKAMQGAAAPPPAMQTRVTADVYGETIEHKAAIWRQKVLVDEAQCPQRLQISRRVVDNAIDQILWIVGGQHQS
ncbi:hypothetical protein B0H17DRAFT_1132276 [Mycena rosella]|uniref:Uncharacterized protein n=1 Tax=Mycena rosella TaxID=1033263 RepID=A0AAD7DL35_MYCRO|nr:hypothetical protein B0H17DRAFT_1132276 [Mycena rosella]